MTRERDRIQENANRYIVKNCPCYTSRGGYYDCWANQDTWCENITDCVIKQVIEKLKEADNSCDGKNCTECSGFYMCHSQFANKILQLFDIEEINDRRSNKRM